MRTPFPERPFSTRRTLAILVPVAVVLATLVLISPNRQVGDELERVEYLAAEPVRVASGQELAAGAEHTVRLDDVPRGATGAVLGLTGTRARAATSVALCGGAEEDPQGCAGLPFPQAGATASTFAVAPVDGSPASEVRLVNGPGEVTVSLDLLGYLVPSRHLAPADRPELAPRRLRPVALGAGTERAVRLPGVPVAATAVVVEIQAADATARTRVTSCAAGEVVQTCPPTVAAGPGRDGKDVTVLPLSPTTPGRLSLWNEAGDVSVTVLVHAYLVPGSSTTPAGYVMPVAAEPLGGPGPLAAGDPRTLTVDRPAPAGVTGAVLHVSATGGEEDASLAICPGEAGRSCARAGGVAAGAGSVVAGVITVPLGGDDQVSVYTTGDLPRVAVALDGWVVGSVPFGAGPTLGWLDRAAGVTRGVEVRGWAIDPASAKPVHVTVLLDGVPTRLTADLPRPDLARTYPEHGGAHGFATMLEAPPGRHQVCATAGASAGGEERVLGCVDVEVPESPRADVPESAPPPDASSTGVLPGTTLVPHEGDLVVTAAGTVVEDLDVHGVVVVLADDVVIRNSRIRGREASSKTALVSNELGAKNLLVVDTEIAPDEPSWHLYGVIGWEFTLERVNIHHVVDSAHVYGPNVTIRSSWLHDNVHYENDPNFGGTPTHDDGIQIQRGHNIRVVGSRIEGAFNAAVQITQDVGRTSDVELVGNWLDGGGCTVNVNDKGRGDLRDIVMTGNRFGRGTRNHDCAIIAPRSAGVQAWNNLFVDGTLARVRTGV